MPHSQQPVSPERLAANRANAAKSTGPGTPQGKARSAQNARKHGFTASTFAVERIALAQQASTARRRSPTVGRCSCAIRPRRNATGRPLGHGRSRSSNGSKRFGKSYRTNPFPEPNPNKMNPLAPLTKRTQIHPKSRKAGTVPGLIAPPHRIFRANREAEARSLPDPEAPLAES
jgi:hypothetical protein